MGARQYWRLDLFDGFSFNPANHFILIILSLPTDGPGAQDAPVLWLSFFFLSHRAVFVLSAE